jgi:2-keto-4-pentenoate hydratase/2-oxohepta-3-ene-1,7-dioic acid hydratase in catechol pathway
MRIAAIHGPTAKLFGTVDGDDFRPLLSGGRGVSDLRQVIAMVGAGRLERGPATPLSKARLAAPVGPLPKNVMAVGKNYHDHAQEFARSGIDQSGDKQEVPEFPVVFTKAINSLADPGQGIPASADPSNSTDYEGEFGVVIGRAGKNIKKADAYDHVFGYTIVNDATARAIQQRHKQWFLGKSLDGFCPVGPVIVTRDAFGVPDAQVLTTVVNGEQRQSAPLRDLIFDVPTIIEAISAFVPLEVGDLIATGTPAGVGIGFKPPKYLKPGDEVRIAVTGIGELVNPVV